MGKLVEQVPKTLDQLSDDDLFNEYQSRKKAGADLMEFIRYTKVDFNPSLHHHYLSEKLEGVINGDIKRLIVTMPPRHGKSEMASRRLPAYYLGKHPTREIICATYNSDFAAEFGRNVREIVNTEEYSNVFPEIAIKSTDRAADRWSLTSGGGFRAAGVGGGLTGRGGHLIIIDDPIKSREEADSKLQRDRIWDWYRSVVYTRQAPNCAFIIIQTRWHDDDLAGRLLAEALSEGEQWELINFPALAYGEDALGRKEGEPLWPNWFPLQMLEQVRRTIGPREWSALYQQTPVEDDGSYFKRQWIEDFMYDRVSLLEQWDSGTKNLHTYGASDYAVTSQGGDYTVHIVVGVDESHNIYILDLWRAQTTPEEWVDSFCDLVLQWKPLRWGEESGQIIKSVGPFLQRRMTERQAYCAREPYSSTRDKATRARSIQARMAMGKVFWPRHQPWLGDMMHEMLRFPAGVHDDMVDALSLIGRMMDTLAAAPEVAFGPSEELIPTTWGDAWKNHIRQKKGRRSGGGIVMP
tara:strand:+ start:2346 stop:3911 length:1566 start_codon:yes stop_codon:yes gene_type:complete